MNYNEERVKQSENNNNNNYNNSEMHSLNYKLYKLKNICIYIRRRKGQQFIILGLPLSSSSSSNLPLLPGSMSIAIATWSLLPLRKLRT